VRSAAISKTALNNDVCLFLTRAGTNGSEVGSLIRV
jgi:hypothetical protein